MLRRFLPPRDHTRFVIELWRTNRSRAIDYFDKAESDEWTDGFWNPGTPFRAEFDRLDLTAVLELACGFGRHARRIADRCGRLTLLDTSEYAIARCRERFADLAHVDFILSTTGRDFPGVADRSLSAVYSYDSMVHFEAGCVFAYLREIHRALRPGGRALLHHSAWRGRPARRITRNPCWRACMDPDEFAHESGALGFRIESMRTFPWHSRDVTDALTLLLKP